MKFKLLITCCYAVVCLCSNAMQPISSQGSKEREHKPPLYPTNEHSLSQRDLAQQPKNSNKKGEIFDETTFAAEQLINLSRGGAFQSNASLDEKEEVIKARCLFLASIRDITMFRQMQRRIQKEAMIWEINIKKWQQELQIMQRSAQKEAMIWETNIKKWQRELQILNNRIRELEKNIRMTKKEAAFSYLLLKLTQRKAKLKNLKNQLEKEYSARVNRKQLDRPNHRAAKNQPK